MFLTTAIYLSLLLKFTYLALILDSHLSYLLTFTASANTSALYLTICSVLAALPRPLTAWPASPCPQLMKHSPDSS